ncbi:MAG: CHAT domain-containing protein [Bacteroidia bacterium]|nr:CHAT domain-containing protein [Bacteroidia bacterium]
MKFCRAPGITLFCTLFFLFCMIVPWIGRAQQSSADKEKEIFSQAARELSNGSYDTALNLFNTLLQIRSGKCGSDSVPVANVLTNIGVIKSQLGLYDDAISFYDRSSAIYEAAGSKELKRLGSVYQNLGICYNAKGDIEKARTYYENTDRIFQKLEMSDQQVYEILLMNLTLFYLDNKKISEAEKFNDKSIELNKKSPLNFKKWTSSGLICFEKKDFIKSISFLNKAVSTGEKDLGTDFAEKGLIYMNLGMVYLELEDFDHSLANYLTAKKLLEKSMGGQGISYSSCLKDIGLNYLRKKESESNLEEFLVQRKKNLETSLDYFQKAIIAITPGFISNNTETNPSAEDAIDKTRLLDVIKNKAEAFYLISQLEEKLGNKEASLQKMKLALENYDLSIKTIHLIRNGFQNQESRLFLSENEHPVYANAVKVAVRLYETTHELLYFEKGFEISERSRSADFQAMLREVQAKKFSDVPDSLLKKETDLKGQIAAYENFIFNEKSSPSPDQKKINLWKDKVFSLSQSYRQMISLIEKKYPTYYQYKYADPIVPVQKIQGSLERREAFVEYFINYGGKKSDGELYTFVITNQEYKIIRRTINSELDETIDHFLQFIKNGDVLKTRKSDFIKYTKNASQLYKLLIEPIEPSLKDYRLVIVPDDKLSYLPFDAFLVSSPDTSKMDFRNLDYLVHHHAISYTYSATLLYYYFQNNYKYSNKIGAFAPDYTDEKATGVNETDHFLPLPGAEAEITGITALIPGDQYLKGRANKQNFLQKAGNYDILHLAMHTVLNDTLPLYSKMVFSADSTGEKERTLNTFEIYNLKLKSNMVVLSGCNTGTGKLQKGEGVMSLARGFFYAGCPCIIMTLWNVEDISSSTMMIEFYRNLKNGFSKDEALRKAKVSYISGADPLKAHPYFWLGYVSIGKQTPLFKTKVGYFVSLIIFVFLAIVLEKWYFKRKKRVSQLK